MRKLLFLAVIALGCAVATPRASAQSAFFVYTGVPTIPIAPGGSFTINVSLAFTSGGTINELSGLSYWMAQSSPVGGPFPITITNRNIAGSLFTDLQAGLSYPQRLDPINRNFNGTTGNTDLGAVLPKVTPPQPTGTYFIANITFKVSATAAAGTYTVGNTTAATPGVGGRLSLLLDADGDIAPIAASSFTVGVSGMTFSPTQVVSRKSHNGVPFDIDLPLTANSGIECRPGGATGGYQVVFTFANPVTFKSAAVTAGTGTVSSTSGNGTTAITVNLANVNNAQRITVMLSGVNDGKTIVDVSVPMGVLVGDTNGDGLVNAGDTVATRIRSGRAADATNFYYDVNLDGFINSGDTTIVRTRSGTALP